MKAGSQLRKRVGVFICHCGTNIAGTVNVSDVAEYASSLPRVMHTETNLFACSEDGIAHIERSIREHGLDRVVVAACTPRTHERLFKDACEEAGINRHLLEFVSIREHCSWVHQTEPASATEKAKELVRMGVARVTCLTPQKDIEAPIIPAALVIGGGVAGMSAALNLARQGIRVHLVEKERALGGLLRCVDRILPGDVRPRQILSNFRKSLKENPNVAIHLNRTVGALQGSIGDFSVNILSRSRPSKTETIKVGAIIVATGATELKPHGMYGYGRMKNVVTQLELEEMLKDGGRYFRKTTRLKHVVFVNCVGARIDDREYCGRFCCMTSIKNALRIREMAPHLTVTILERDVMTCGVAMEKYYRMARESGVRFIRYEAQKPPRILGGQRPASVRFYSPTSRRRIEARADMVVLTTPLVPREDSKTLSQLLRVPLGSEGFFLEAHVKLRPVEFSNDGIYVCGSARYPANAPDSISQGYAAASHAAAQLRKDKILVEPITSQSSKTECTGCGVCVSVCPYDAIQLETSDDGKTTAHVTEVKCKGCGCCVASCPSGAMQQRNWGDSELYAALRAVNPPAPDEPKVLIYACNWCSYAGADLAGVSRYQIPHNIRVVRFMCSSRVSPEWVVRALTNGMDGVMILGCHPGECHYVDANLYTRRRAIILKRLLELTGISPYRFKLDWVSASEGRKFAAVVGDFVQELKRQNHA